VALVNVELCGAVAGGEDRKVTLEIAEEGALAAGRGEGRLKFEDLVFEVRGVGGEGSETVRKEVQARREVEGKAKTVALKPRMRRLLKYILECTA
jgi:hypothetical protein